MANQIRFDINFNVNQAELTKLKNSFKEISDNINEELEFNGITEEMEKAGQAAQKVGQILQESFNTKLGTLNIQQFQQKVEQTFGSMQNLQTALAGAGEAGVQAFNNMNNTILRTNTVITRGSEVLNRFADTFKKTLVYGATSRVFNNLVNQMDSAAKYARTLDTSLNDIRIVTGESAEKMAEFAVNANKAAKDLGASTLDYTNAALIYYQQGLSEEEVAARAEVTLKAANVTGQTGKEVSEQLTAVWNGYKVTAEEAELYVDKLAAVAASTASNLEELSTGMSKVASAAASMGVGVDSLNAQLATIISVTRQAPESVGTALKTIYARMANIQAGLDEEDITLTQYTEKMANMGVYVLDANNKLRDMQDVIEEVGEKWGDFTREQQMALSQAMAGARQYNNLLALFENWDNYKAALQTSKNAMGTLQDQQDIYMESTAAHLQQLRTEWQRTYALIADQGLVRTFTDLGTVMLSGINNYIEGLGGGAQALASFGSLALSIFRDQIGTEISNTIQRIQTARQQAQQLKDLRSFANAVGQTATSEATKTEYEYSKRIFEIRNAITEKQRESLITQKDNITALTAEVERYKQMQESGTTWADVSDDIDNAKRNLTELTQTQQSLNSLIGQAVAAEQLYLETENDAIAQQEVEKESAEVLAILQEASIRYQQIANTLSGQNVLTQQEQARLQSLINELSEADIPTREQINSLREQESLIAQKLHAQQTQLNEDSKIYWDIEQRGLIETKQAELDNAKAVMDSQLGVAQRANKATVAVKGVSAAMAAIPLVTNTLPKLLDETTSKAEKLQATFSGISSAAMGIGMAFGPIGMAIGAAVSVVAQIANTIFSNIEKRNQEAIDNINKAWSSLPSEINEIDNNISYYEDVEAEYKYLSKGVNELGQNVSLTETEYERFREILNEVIEINPDIVLGYDNQGEALIRINGLLDEQIEKQEELKREKLEDITSASNAEDLTKSVQQDLTDREKAIKKAEKELRKAGEKTATNWVRPVNGVAAEVAAELNELTKNGKAISENGELIKQKIDEYNSLVDEEFRISDQQISEWDALGLGYEAAQDNLEKARQEYEDGLKGFDDYLVAIAQLNDKYESLDNTSQSLIEKYIRNLIISDPDNLNKSREELEEQVNDLINNWELDGEKVNEMMLKTLPQEGETRQEWINRLAAMRNEIIEAFAASGLEGEDLNTLIESMLGVHLTDDGFTVATTELFQNLQNDLESALGDFSFNLGDYISEDDLSLNGNEIAKTIERIGDSSLSAEKKASLLQQVLGALHISDDLVESEQEITKIGASIDSIQTVLTQITQGEEFKNKDLREALGEVLDAYPELQNLQQRANHEQIERLREIGELEETRQKKEIQNYIDKRKEEYDYYNALLHDSEVLKDASEEDIEAWKETAQEAISDIVDKEYEIRLSLNTDLQTDWENAFNLADEINALGDMVSETLEVTFDQAKEIIEQGYGAILQNAHETAEGTIQLDKEVADAYIANKRREIETDKQAKIEELEGERTLLQTRAEILDAQAEALEKSVKAKTKEEAAYYLASAKMMDVELQENQMMLEGKLEATENEQKAVAEGQQELTDYLAELDANIANDAAAAAQSGAQSAAEMAKSAIRSANAMGMAWHNAWEAARGGDFTPAAEDVEAGSIASTFTASQTAAYEGSNAVLEQIQSDILAINDITLEAIQNAAEAQLQEVYKEQDLIQQQIGAIDAGIAALNTSSKSLDKAVSTMGTKEPGSKGSSGSSKKADTMDLLKDEIDKYHDINNELKQIAANLKLIQGQEDKAIRNGLTQNLDKQLSILKQQEDAQKRKLELAKADLQLQAANLQAKGVQIGSDGQIVNYAQILATKQAEINALIAQYNGLSAADQEGYKTVIEQKKKEYEELQKMMSTYDTLLNDTIPSLINDIQDTIDAQLDAQIKKFNVMIEAHLDIKQVEEEWNEFKGRVILDLKEDDFLGKAQNALERFNNYYRANGSGIIQELTDHVKTITEQVKSIEATGTSSIYGDNEAQAMEDLKKYNSELMNSLEEIKDLEEEIYEDYLDLIDKAQDAFDKQVETYEQISDILDHNINLAKMLWGDTAYDTLDKYYSQMATNNNQQLDFLRQQRDMWKQLMDNEEVGSRAWEEYRKNWMQSVSDLNTLVENSVENLLNKYENARNKIYHELELGLTNGLGFDYLNDQWDIMDKRADKFLDKINQGYGIQKLENSINQSLNDLSGNVAAQKALNDLKNNELQQLKDMDKITQYDLDRAEALYQIELKKIALQQAQQNKSTMRLRRDSQGNYTYQYVADDSAVADAQQALEDAFNQLYNLDKQEYHDTLEEMFEMYQEYLEKMQAIDDNKDLTDEQKDAQRKLLREEYYGYMTDLYDHSLIVSEHLLDSATQEYDRLYDTNYNNFEDMDNAIINDLMTNLVPQWNSGVAEMTRKFCDDADGFLPSTERAWEELSEVTQQYQNDLDILANAAGIDFSEIAEGIDHTIYETQALLWNNGELINQYWNEINAIQAVVRQLNDMINMYNQAQQAAINAASAAHQVYVEAIGAAQAIREMYAAMANGAAAASAAAASAPGVSTGSSGGGSSSGSSSSSSGNHTWTVYSTNDDGSSNLSESASNYNTAMAIASGREGQGYSGTIYKDGKFYDTFDTGGYTGDWNNSNGRLAVLHEKELVLNADDTKNILDAVAVIRNLTSKTQGLGVQLDDMARYTGTPQSMFETVQQTVSIDAQFPNVTNSDEIQQAFNELVGMASQYASSNKRRI